MCVACPLGSFSAQDKVPRVFRVQRKLGLMGDSKATLARKAFLHHTPIRKEHHCGNHHVRQRNHLYYTAILIGARYVGPKELVSCLCNPLSNLFPRLLQGPNFYQHEAYRGSQSDESLGLLSQRTKHAILRVLSQ